MGNINKPKLKVPPQGPDKFTNETSSSQFFMIDLGVRKKVPSSGCDSVLKPPCKVNTCQIICDELHYHFRYTLMRKRWPMLKNSVMWILFNFFKVTAETLAEGDNGQCNLKFCSNVWYTGSLSSKFTAKFISYLLKNVHECHEIIMSH